MTLNHLVGNLPRVYWGEGSLQSRGSFSNGLCYISFSFKLNSLLVTLTLKKLVHLILRKLMSFGLISSLVKIHKFKFVLLLNMLDALNMTKSRASLNLVLIKKFQALRN